MKNIFNTSRPYYLVGWTLLGLLLILSALEGWRYTEKPTQTTNQREIRQELVTAANEFVNKQQELLSHTEKLAGSLQPLLIQSRPPSKLYQQLPVASEFWGIALYQ